MAGVERLHTVMQCDLQVTSPSAQALRHFSAVVMGAVAAAVGVAASEEGADSDEGAETEVWALATATAPARMRAVKRMLTVFLGVAV